MKNISLILILITIFTIDFNSSLAADIPKKNLTTIRSSFNYFLKTMKAYKLGNIDALEMAISTFDKTKLAKDTRTISAKTAAEKLINTLDRLEYIDVKDFPETTTSGYWTYQKRSVSTNGSKHNVEISMHKIKNGHWLFTPKTLATIAIFERAVKGKDVVSGVTQLKGWKEELKSKMPSWTGQRLFILLNGQWLGLLSLIFISFLIERIFRLYVTNIVMKLLEKKRVTIADKTYNKLMTPLGIILFTLLWCIGVRFLELDDALLSWMLKAGRFVLTLAAVIALYQLVDFVCAYLEKKAYLSENKFDDILVPLIRKSAKTFVVAIGIIAMGDALTFDMKGLIAGMGIIGLGVSLAAKDTLSNIFGSLTVLLDRPFSIGDWVVIDGKVEGTVEEVGLRSCRIRTFYNSLITIPNGTLTNAHIDNYGMRTYRRFSTTLGIQYDTPVKKVEAFCEAIRQLIAEHPDTRKDYFHVYLNGLGSSSLNILLYVFFVAPDWSEELQQRHRLLVDILRLGHNMGVSFAFPTQTLHVINSENVNYDELPEDKKIEHYAKELSSKINKDSLTYSKARSSKETMI